MRLLIFTLLGLVVLALLWVRLAPDAPDRWQNVESSNSVGDWPSPGSFEAVRRAEPGALPALHAIIMATTRTKLLSGTLQEARLTYVSRSRVFGFPDYTTVWQTGSELHIFGRLRFGRSDLGVNRARIEGWLAEMPATLVSPLRQE